MFLLLALLQINIHEVNAVPYNSYTYDFWAQVNEAPQAYVPANTIHSSMLGVDKLKNPQDLFIGHDNTIYLLDTGNNRLLIFNQEWELIRQINKFENKGSKDGFKQPEGVFATKKGNIFIADTGNNRVLKFDSQGDLLTEIDKPETDVDGVFLENFVFKPSKVGVDQAGRVYVIAKGVYDGIMEFDIDGNFRGYTGAPSVTPNIIDYLWSRIGTKAQRENMNLFLPTEYSNLDIDNHGFIYATVDSGRKELIVRLNSAGRDILRRLGFYPPIGDIEFPAVGTGAEIQGPSAFADIVSQNNDVYSVLDRKRNRIFTYNSNGNLLYVFGSPGNVKGTFTLSTAIDNLEDNIIALDRGTGFITIYEPTDYAKSILSAIDYYQKGNYDMSTVMWKRVLKQNTNYNLAYSGIGKALFRQRRYKEAMRHFQLGNDRVNYSNAFTMYRKDMIIKYFPIFMILLILILVLIFYVTRKRDDTSTVEAKAQAAATLTEARNLEMLEDRTFKQNVIRTLKGMQYSFYLIFHPFDGFWELKREKRGNLPAAISILTLVLITYLAMRQYTGFIFNTTNIRILNILVESLSILFPVGLWVVINWSLTTLMDGKGTVKDIFIYSVFSLIPFVIINLPLTLISNFITIEEGAFYYFFVVLAAVWSGFLIFVGTAITHNYEMSKTLLAILGIIVGICFVIFLGLVFFTVLDQVIKYILDIYTEISLRM